MAIRIVIVVAALVVGAVWLGSARGGVDRTQCTAGVTTVAGQPARVFCGPARATVHYLGRTYAFANGLCKRAPAFTVNLGTVTPARSVPPSLTYFGLVVEGTKPGTYRGTKVLVAFQVGSMRVGLHDLLAEARPDTSATLTGSSGTFSGKDAHGNLATGSFTC
ncbi:MAG TPA: hypothetical protein VGF23_09575 [Gaiellaceae bacterium]|jgi:hypothetical protein